MKLGFLGPAGTYTEEAAHAAMADAEYLPYPSIEAVFTAVARQDIGRGLVPIENVIQGPVTETLDHLYRYAEAVKIVDMLMLPIEHALGVLRPEAPIQRILSKDQALKQCSDYLHTHYPQAQQVEIASTSAAMQQIVAHQQLDAAAIGSAAALQHYGLHVLARDIGNIKNNKTRFAILGSRHDTDHVATGRDATALGIYPHRDRIGLLEDILAIISKRHGLNLSSIHSRPDTLGAFRFHIEVAGHRDDPAVAACIADLTKELGDAEVDVKIFGTYPHHAFNEPRVRTIGILGGTGQMGRWFDAFFRAAGYTVLLSGRRTALTYAQCIAQSDVVIINVPIHTTVAVIEAVGGLFQPGQLLVDNTSIKTQPVAAMLNAVPAGVEVLGMHTVFGPAIDTVRQQNVIFTRTAASGEIAREFENIFYKYGAKITHTTPEYHDRQMAFHQNLEHFTKIVLAEVLRQHFPDPSEMDYYSSPNSRTSLATMGRILSADPELYSEIQSFNLQAPTLLRTYLECAERLGQALMTGHVDSFKESMHTSITTLGNEYLARMLDRSKTIQRHLA